MKFLNLLYNIYIHIHAHMYKDSDTHHILMQFKILHKYIHTHAHIGILNSFHNNFVKKNKNYQIVMK